MAVKTSPVDMEKRKALDLRPGDTVRVYQKIEEKGKYRLQVFEGLVLARTFKHSIILTLILGLLVMVQQYLTPWMIP